MKKTIVALLAVGTFGTIAIPAQADNANVQTSGSTTITTGDYNSSTSTTRQDIRSTRVNDSGNNGNVQDSTTVQDTYGSGNRTRTETDQEIKDTAVETRRGYRR